MSRIILTLLVVSCSFLVCAADGPSPSPSARPEAEKRKEAADEKLKERAKAEEELSVIPAESKQDSQIRKALGEPATVAVKKTRLGTLLETLGTQWNLNLQIDQKALEEESITKLEKEMTIKFDGISRRSVLAGLLKPEMNYYVANGALVISSETKCKEQMRTVVYPVRSVVSDADAPDFEPLMEVVRETIDPDSWQENGGSGTMRPFEASASLVVRTSEQIHEKVLALLVELRLQRKEELQRTTNRPAIGANALEQNLDKPISVHWKHTPVREALQTLAENIGVAVLFDERTLKEQGVSLDAPLTLNAKQLPASTALAAIRRIEPQVDVLFEKEILLVTSTTKADEKRETRIYNVSDLVATTKAGGNAAKLIDILKGRVPSAIPKDKSDPAIKAVEISGVQMLQIVLSQREHREIARCLRELREQVPPPDAIPNDEKADKIGAQGLIGNDGTGEEVEAPPKVEDLKPQR